MGIPRGDCAVNRDLLAVQGLTKHFVRIQALADVSFTIQAGEIVGLVGANGAGKSTLIKILAGVHRPDAGSMHFRGEPYNPSTPAAAQHAGLAFIHQEVLLCPKMSVAANLCLGQIPERRVLGLLRFVDRRAMAIRARSLLGELGLHLNVDQIVERLPLATRQLVAIARALATRPGLLVMDEPTASLERREVERLFDLLRQVRAGGTAVVFVSHRLDEVLELTDRIIALRDGVLVADAPTAGVSGGQLAEWVAGRTVAAVDRPPPPTERVALAVDNLQTRELAEPLSLALRAGEVAATTGLLGSGSTEAIQALGGQRTEASGRLKTDAGTFALGSPQAAIAAGLGYVPEDRRGAGLVPNLSVAENIGLRNLNKISGPGGFIRRRRLTELAAPLVRELQIKTPALDTPVRNLSGGNQQKVVIAKSLASDCRVLVMQEPTHGIDVGAKSEVRRLISSFAAAGGAVLFASLEMPDVVGLAHRVLVFHRGVLRAERDGESATPADLMALAGGVAPGDSGRRGEQKTDEADQ